MTITPANWLNFGNLLQNEIFGDVILLFLVVLVFIAYKSMEYRAPTEVTIGLILLAGAVIVGIAYQALLWILILLFVGVIVYVQVSRWVKRS